MKHARRYLSLALVVALAGCSTSELLEGEKIDYKSATRGRTLEVPPDLTRPTAGDRYLVPDLQGRPGASALAYQQDRAGKRASTEVLPDVANVRIERAGTQRWLVVQKKPEEVWPVLKEFWQELGFVFAVESADSGVLETDWAENRANIPQDSIRSFFGKLFDSLYSTGERDKFRTRIERGADGTTEIYISHRGMYEEFDKSDQSASGRRTVWVPREPDPDLEADMMRRLMVRLGVQQERAKVIVAASQAMPEQAKLSADSRQLQMQDPFDRAWRRVGLALDRVGFTVVDRNRAEGTYFVRYADTDANQQPEKRGFFSRLAFWRSNERKVDAVEYRVLLKESAGQTQVSLLTKEGQPDGSETGPRILKLLHDQLK